MSSRLQSAISLHDRGQLDDAVRVYREYLRADPDCSEAQCGLGAALVGLGHAHDAIEVLKRAIQSNPRSVSANFNLGGAHMLSGQPQEALGFFDRTLDLQPGLSEAYFGRGDALTALGRLRKATEAYERGLRINCVPYVAESLAELHVQLGNLDQAISTLRRTVDHCAPNASLLRKLGGLLCHTRQLEGAVNAYQDALEIAPDDAESYFQLGTIFLDQGKLDESEKCFRGATRSSPESTSARYNLAYVLGALKRYPDAIEQFESVLREKPDHLASRFHLGRCLERLDQLDQAERAYRMVLERQPSNVQTLCRLGNVLCGLDRLEAAEELFRQALRIEPNHVETMGYLASVLVYTEQFTKAKAVVRQWLNIKPEDPYARHMLAVCTRGDGIDRASDDYIRAEFDEFADTYEEKMAKLAYSAPERTSAIVAAESRRRGHGLRILDAGCGTGWCGPLLRPSASYLAGVDLSEKMIDQAGTKEVYDELEVGELTEFLRKKREAYDIVHSADTLNYFGNLKPVFRATFEALRARGLLVFTVEAWGDQSGDGYQLQRTGRYCHRQEYLRSTLAEAGLFVESLESIELRKERGVAVIGHLVTAAKVE